jgi:hypothetical protein
MTPSTRPKAISATFTTVIAAMLIFSMTAAPVLAAAGSGPDINYESDKASPAYIHEDTLTIAEYDRSEMTLSSDQIEYYNDDGEVEELPAHYNQSQDEPVTVRYTQIDAAAFTQFPRVDGESGNSQTWTNASNWTTATSDSTNVSPTVEDSDGEQATGVESVTCRTSGMGSGDTAECQFETQVNVSQDVDKRVLLFAGNVSQLGGDVEVRLVDADGDFYYATINTSENAEQDWVIANSTGDGYVFQEKLSNLNGSGTVNEIQQVEINASDGDIDIAVTALDVESKSTIDLGTAVRDADGDGDEDDDVQVEQINGTVTQGDVDLASLSSMGSWADDARVMNLDVHDVRYSEQNLASSSDWNVTFSDADQYQYPRKLDKDVRLQAPAQIDLSHGNLELRVHQGLVDARYANIEYATDTGDTDFENISSTTDKTSSMTNKSGYVVMTTSINAGNNQYVGSTILLQSGDEDELQSTGGTGGGAPVEDDSGGFFSTAWGKLMAALGGVLAFLGLRRNSG